MKTFALCALAALVAVAPVTASFIEHAYCGGIYRVIQPTITSASNAAPFALLDILLVLILIAWIAHATRDVRRAGWVRAFVRAILRTLRWSATAYLAFVVLWGWNYRRAPLVDRLAFDRGTITAAAVRRIATVSVQRLNALAASAHAQGWYATGDIDPQLVDGFRTALREVELPPAVVGRPKRTLLDPYFRRAGVDGMTDPFFLETLVASDLLPFERPLVVAHEWGHLAGLANEAEANFIGWLACLRGSPADQYSGWIFLYEETAAALASGDRRAVAAALTSIPRADLVASVDRARRNVKPAVAEVAWRAYDSYLKSNRVVSGTRSYAEVVQLVAGTEFTGDWVPRLNK